MKEKNKEIEERLRKVLYQNPYYGDFADKLKTLVESHPFFIGKTEAKSSR